MNSAEDLISYPCVICDSFEHSVKYPAKLSLGDEKPNLSCTNSGHGNHYQIVTCNKCGMVYSSPRPKPKFIEDIYSQTEDEIYVKEERGRYKTFSNVLKRFPKKSGKMLDIGCNTGIFLEEAKRLGFETYGIEPSVHSAQRAREVKGLNVIAGVAPCETPWNTKFEFITLWDVIEHLCDPLPVLHFMKDLLTDDGEVHIATMNLDSLYVNLVGENWPWYMEMHLHYFTVKSITKLLERAGFKVTKTYGYTHIVHRDYLEEKLKSIWSPLVFPAKLVSKLIMDSEGFIPVNLGDMMHIVAVKR